MAALISITHITRYTYDRPVEFGEHRLLVRPRDGHDLRVISAHLSISPPSTLRWHFDTFGNSVAHVHFSEAADHLEIRSDLLIKRYEQNAVPEQQDSALHRMHKLHSAWPTGSSNIFSPSQNERLSSLHPSAVLERA